MNQLFKYAATLLTALLLTGGAAWGQKQQVTGKVTEASTGEPVPGAAILVKGGTGGVITDASGNYAIQAAPDATLLCTLIGYQDKEQNVGGRAQVDFALELDAEMLEETVVVGYGTLKKSQLVGSVEQISGENLEGRTNANVSRTLQARFPA